MQQVIKKITYYDEVVSIPWFCLYNILEMTKLLRIQNILVADRG